VAGDVCFLDAFFADGRTLGVPKVSRSKKSSYRRKKSQWAQSKSFEASFDETSYEPEPFDPFLSEDSVYETEVTE